VTLTRQDRWYHALEPVTATVDCEGQPHRVSWRRGKLVLEDHDLTAERTMLVFGGQLCVCMRVLEMWRHQFGMAPDAFLQMDRWLGDNAYLAPKEFGLVRELGMVVSWERAWRRTSHLHHKQARLLEDELKARALRPLREHLNASKATVGARMVSTVGVRVIPSWEAARLDGRVEGISLRAQAWLRGRWPVDVWGRGVAVVDGAFVLEVTEVRSPDELEVRAVRWERQLDGTRGPIAARARARRRDGSWQLAWEAG
jgi:hypothetical protein